MRTIEAIVLLLIATIGVCYYIEIFVLPQSSPRFCGDGEARCSRPAIRQAGMLYAAIGIIGATVMPHNLYLHSALVQSRDFKKDEASKRTAIRFNTIDSVAALTVAFFVNAAIMVLAAMVFYGKTSVTVAGGEVVTFSPDSDWIRIASLTLAPLLGTTVASVLFVIALLASGQSSTITGTLAGQVVMEGFMHWRLRPWLRRLITRTLAIIPAVLIIGVRGNSSVTDLMNLSQVVLAHSTPPGDVSIASFHQFPQTDGRVEERLVPAVDRLVKRDSDYGDGHHCISGLSQIGLACDRGELRGIADCGLRIADFQQKATKARFRIGISSLSSFASVQYY